MKGKPRYGITYEDLENILRGKSVRVCKNLFVKMGDSDVLSTNSNVSAITLTQRSLENLIINECVYLSDFVVEMSE